MSEKDPTENSKIHAEDHSIAVGGIQVGGDARGDIRIGHTIGYTSEQVSVLIAQISSTFQAKPFDGRCPYKGLEVFEEEDADLFFGRERLVEDLVERVKESRTVFITGPSGSGKSSLVRAGFIHALKQGALKKSERWLYEIMKPGREPLKDLALAFSRLKSPDLADYFQAHASEKDILNKCAESILSGRKDQRFLLFIDQFEEVFTQISQEAERVAFINMLAHAGTVENGRVIILFAMRSDFVSNCATYPALNEMLSQQFRQIGAMQPEELVSAIALPAKHVGLPIEDELIARIINDMKGEPGALPLMQFALKDLFDSQQEKGGVISLTLEDYLRHGGIHKSLERHADASFAKLSENEQELARSIFSGLIEIGRGTQDTRRTALFDELVPASAKATEVESVVQRLADARLIITDEQAGKDTVTISHEKLIDAWPWLKKLVNENRDVIALQNETASDAKEWDERNRDKSYLYTGARLANAREQLEARKLVLSELAQRFIEAGVKAHADELEAAKQRTAQLRQRSVYLSVALAFALIAVGAAILFGIQARQQETIARARELAAQSVALRENNFRMSLLLAIEAFRLQTNNVQTRGALRDAANANPQLVQFLTGYTGWINSQAFSPNGKLLASGSSDGTIVLWDVETRQLIDRPFMGHTGSIYEIAFSPDSTMLASTSIDKTIILWDVASGQQIGQPLAGHKNQVSGIAFSPDGETLASAGDQIVLWDVASHRPIGLPLTGHTSYVYSVAFSPDGKTLASGSSDKTIILWDVASGQQIGEPLAGHKNQVRSIAFTPDGETLASAGDQIILWDLNAPQPTAQPFIGQTSVPHSIAFGKDGTMLASGNEDSTIRLWDVTSRQEIGQPLRAHTGFAISIAFSPDGKTLASSSLDNMFILWNIADHQGIGQTLKEYTSWVTSVSFSPDRKTLASGSSDGTIILWDVASRQQIDQPLAGHTGSIESIAFSPDGQTLASGSSDGTIILWDVASLEPVTPPLGHPDVVFSVAFSPDGKTLASGNTLGGDDSNYTIILWDVSSRQPIGQPIRYTSFIYSLDFSPDGKTLASASGDGDNTIMLWNVASHQPTGQRLMGHTALITTFTVAFSPDGQTLASAGFDELILWDILSRQPIGQTITTQSGLSDIAFSPDGKTLASGGAELILWNLNPESWIKQSCQRAGGNFTLGEWERYFPNEEYRKTCEQWPLEPEVTATAPP